MEDKKWYWDSLNLLYNYQNKNYTTWGNYSNFIIVKRKTYIKLIHKKLHTDNGSAYIIKIIEYDNYYDLELVGSIEMLTNIIKQCLRHIKLKELGI